MSTVGRNIAANFAGQLWSALMGVVFIPAYIHLLGLESFGLIGFFLTLQALALVFDLGMAATINREIARAGAWRMQETRDLVRTLEWIYWPLGTLVALVIWLCSDLLAQSWLRPVDIDSGRVGFSIALMALAIGAQWPTSFYAAGLNGLQRQVQVNALAATFGTLRGAGVLAPLVIVSPTLEVFFYWQATVSALQTLACAFVFWGALPPADRAPRFSVAEFSRVGGFTAGLSAIGMLSFILIQADRIILSRLLSLDKFGVYVLAASVAAALMRLVLPWFSAFYPRFSQLLAQERSAALQSVYHASCQCLAATVLPAAAVTAVFSEDLLRLWTGDLLLAKQAAPLLAVLICGTALNGLLHLPYAMQLAYGWTSLALWANLVGVCFLLPSIWLLALTFGSIGAASAWVLLNTGYVLIVIPLMHRRILRGQLADWYFRDVGLPALASIAAVLALDALGPPIREGVEGVITLVAIYATATAAACAVCSSVRRYAWTLLGALVGGIRR